MSLAREGEGSSRVPAGQARGLCHLDGTPVGGGGGMETGVFLVTFGPVSSQGQRSPVGFEQRLTLERGSRGASADVDAVAAWMTEGRS